MREQAIHIMETLRKKWILLAWTSYGIISLGIGMVAGELLHQLAGFSYRWMLIFTLLAFICFLFLKMSWRINIREIARFLDSSYPSMEESTTLLLSDSVAEGSLQQIQQLKTITALQREYPNIKFSGKLRQALMLLLISIIFCGIIEWIFYFNHSNNLHDVHKIVHAEKPILPLPSIQFMHIGISPPAYTRVPHREQEQADIYAEEGSALQWNIKTDRPVKSLGFILNDSAKFFLQPKNQEHTEWTFHSFLQAPGFYQLIIDSQISEQYKLDMIRDGFPEIDVASPKPKTILEYGMAEQIPVQVSVRDDYGIRSAGIYCTISNGSGEAVKFTEKQISFNELFSSQNTHYSLQKLIDLGKLGMIPGDELYFYIRATDNHGQEKKSGIFIVSLADTADLMNTDLAVSGLNIKPEYFRSERQIILETQQLLTDRRNLSTEAFNNKSNDLGVDQKMLRLRYGKFLGEEEESGDAGAEKQNVLSNPANFGNAEAILDAYTDKHDNAADATFFEKDTKDQLKATLTEMWNAELQLRIFKPETALPFEYKALRLLKDLQQKSRVYVAKAGYKTTPLDPGKRLSGDQDKILSPSDAWTSTENTGMNNGFREALSILQSLQTKRKPEAHSMELLQTAGGKLREKAIEEPSKYLTAYGSYQKMFNAITKGSVADEEDIQVVEKALQNLIRPVAEIPGKVGKNENNVLSDEYFRNLNKHRE